MSKEELNSILQSIWKLFGLAVFVLLMIRAICEWSQGKQPDNFTVMTILLIAIAYKGGEQ